MDTQITGQMNLFDFLDKLPTKAVENFDPLMKFVERHLGAYVGSKDRIIAFFKDNTSKSERIRLLKEEYGTGGFGGYRFTPDETYAIEGASYDAKGIKVEWYEPGKTKSEYNEKLYSYTEVAEAIDKSIEDGIYHAKYEAAQNSLNDYRKQFVHTIALSLPNDIYNEYLTLEKVLHSESDEKLHNVVRSLMERAREYSCYGCEWETQQCIKLRNIAAKCLGMNKIDWRNFFEKL